MIKKMRLFFFFGMLMQASLMVFAQDMPMKPISINLKDKAVLQRGARLYMNYCSGCHSLKFMRYNLMANDIGLTTFDGQLDEALLKNNLIFSKATLYDPIEIALLPEDAKQWFGVVPPDLSLMTREKGAEWLYTYLSNFYRDDSWRRIFAKNWEK